MGFLKFILTLLANLPQIISLIRAIIDLIGKIEGSDKAFNKREAIRELKEAIRHAKESNDASKLEQMHRELVKRANS